MRCVFFIDLCLADDTFSLVTFHAAYKSTSRLIYYLGGRQKKVFKVTGWIFKKEIYASTVSLSYVFFAAMTAFCHFLLLSCRGHNLEKQEGTNIIPQWGTKKVQGEIFLLLVLPNNCEGMSTDFQALDQNCLSSCAVAILLGDSRCCCRCKNMWKHI